MMSPELEVPDVVALDVETTGLFPDDGDRICELALLKIRQGRVEDRLATLINPRMPISDSACLINGISDAMVKNAPVFEKVAPAVRDFMRGNSLLIHNAGFDLSFLRAQMADCGVEFPETGLFDTLWIARKFFAYSSNSLNDLATEFRILPSRSHRAESDAWTAYLIFRRFLEDLGARDIRPDALRKSTEGVGVELTAEDVLPRSLIRSLERARTNHVPERIRVRYVNGMGEVSVREIEPIEVEKRRRAWYLIAFCHETNERRTFRLDRILEIVENIE